MNKSFFELNNTIGTPSLQLPEELREPIREHLNNLHKQYVEMNWAQHVGYGKNPAIIVIDLAINWTILNTQMGSNMDSVVNATKSILKSAREASIPIFFSTSQFDPDELPALRSKKFKTDVKRGNASLYDLDPRLKRRPNEKILYKKYASCFKGTNMQEMLTALNIDTLILTGVSTSHCVYATARDASDSFRVIVPYEAVGDRCQIMQWINLLDIEIDVGDVVETNNVIDYLKRLKLK